VGGFEASSEVNLRKGSVHPDVSNHPAKYSSSADRTAAGGQWKRGT
jgi:hypothetical protein